MDHNCAKSLKLVKVYSINDSELLLRNKLMSQCVGNCRIVVFKDSHRLRQLCARKIIGSWKNTNNNRKSRKHTFAGEGRRLCMNNDCYDDDDFILTKCRFKIGKNN